LHLPASQLRAVPPLACEELRHAIHYGAVVPRGEERALDAAISEEEIVHGVFGDDFHCAVECRRHQVRKEYGWIGHDQSIWPRFRLRRLREEHAAELLL